MLMAVWGLELALKVSRGKARYDAMGKNILKHLEVLANILKYSVPEYAKYSCEEIIKFIDADSITDEGVVGPNSNTKIQGEDTVQTSLDEANLTFDVLFKVCKPDSDSNQKSQERKNIHLHVDIELQNKYHPGYPIEKRGIYNLARMISSQLDVVNKKTNYNILEKAYCIFICVGGVPRYLWNTVSYHELVNTKNVGNVKANPDDIDLMGLVIIRIGEKLGPDVSDIIHFLHGIFYDVSEVEEYIDFSKNQKFREEMENMALTGEHLIEYGEHRQKEKTEAARKRAEAEKERADEAERKLQDEQEKVEKLEERLRKLEEQIKLFTE